MSEDIGDYDNDNTVSFWDKPGFSLELTQRFKKQFVSCFGKLFQFMDIPIDEEDIQNYSTTECYKLLFAHFDEVTAKIKTLNEDERRQFIKLRAEINLLSELGTGAMLFAGKDV